MEKSQELLDKLDFRNAKMITIREVLRTCRNELDKPFMSKSSKESLCKLIDAILENEIFK